jgi:hypothetical protein
MMQGRITVVIVKKLLIQSGTGSYELKDVKIVAIQLPQAVPPY